MKNFQKIDLSKKKFPISFKKKFRSKIFQKIFHTTPQSFFSVYSKHLKGKLHEGLMRLTSSGEGGGGNFCFQLLEIELVLNAPLEDQSYLLLL